jgi:hypothetical protein
MRRSVVRSLFGCAVLFPFAVHAQSNRAQRTPSINDEAKTVARQILLHKFVQCGTSLYRYAWVDYDRSDRDAGPKAGFSLPAGFQDRPHKQQLLGQTGVILWFYEFKGLLQSLTVRDYPDFSAADRLNGLQWDGEASADSKLAASRTRSWENGAWGPWDTNWYPAGFDVHLRRRNGKWFVVEDPKPDTPVGEILSTPMPSCADLPIR